jgi:hypothetical protein
MSIAVVDADTPTPAKPLPTGVSNLLSFWWLTIVFTCLAALLFWPELPGPFTNKDGVSGFGSGLLWATLLGLVGLGGVGAYWAATSRKTGLTLIKVGTFVGLGVVVGLLVLSLLKSREGGIGGLFEPVPMFSAILVAMVVLLPLTFGAMTLLTLSTADDIAEFYAPADGLVGAGTTGQYVVPAALAGAAATEAHYGEDEGQYAGTATLRPPQEDAFDAAFDEAVEEAVPGSSAEVEASPMAETKELRTSPEAHEEVAEFEEATEAEAGADEVYEFEEVQEAPTEADAGAGEFVQAEEVTDVSAEEGEVFEFELAPDEEQPPPPPPRPPGGSGRH